MKDKNRVAVPNLEWVQGRFVPRRPQEQPTMPVYITVMEDSMRTFGADLSQVESARVQRGIKVSDGLCDTGAQSCSSGVELLERLHFRWEKLLRTCHKISGIANAHMELAGALLV